MEDKGNACWSFFFFSGEEQYLCYVMFDPLVRPFWFEMFKKCIYLARDTYLHNPRSLLLSLAVLAFFTLTGLS